MESEGGLAITQMIYFMKDPHIGYDRNMPIINKFIANGICNTLNNKKIDFGRIKSFCLWILCPRIDHY